MDENPSSPEDGLEGALRRALSEAVGEIEPGADGLGSIRARIGTRPPRPWLLSVLSGAAERVRFWTWRGHWAWPGLPHARAHLPWRTRRPRHRKGAPPQEPRRSGDMFPRTAVGRRRAGLVWLTGALAGVAVIVCVSMSVQPVRQAIIQASTTVFNGGAAPQKGGGETDGAGARTTTDGSAGPAGGATGTVQPGATVTAVGPGGVRPAPTRSSAACQPPTPAGSGAASASDGMSSWDATGTSSATYAVPGQDDEGSATATPDTDVSGAAVPDTPGTAAATPDAGASGATATPDPAASTATICAVTPSPGSATPTTTPAATGAAATASDAPAPTPAGAPTSATASTAQTPGTGQTSGGQGGQNGQGGQGGQGN